MACHLPQHPFHQLCHRPPDDRPELRRSLIGRVRPNIQQYLAEVPLSHTRFKSEISCIHEVADRTSIESSSTIPFNVRSPPIATDEQTLSMRTRTIPAQLRTGHSRILGQYMKGIDQAALSQFQDCIHSPHFIHHLFNCPSKSTTLTVESLFTAPTVSVKYLYLAIEKTSYRQQQQPNAAISINCRQKMIIGLIKLHLYEM